MSYDFEDDILFNDDDVIIKHIYHYNGYLQLKALSTDNVISKSEIKTEGGIWTLQRVNHENGDRNLVKLVNKYNGKYLQINSDGKQVNTAGNGGRITLFEVTLIEANNLKGVRLESVEYSGKYIVIRSDGNINLTDDCSGDIDCVLIFMTTERSKELINLKHDQEIVELQQEIERLQFIVISMGIVLGIVLFIVVTFCDCVL